MGGERPSEIDAVLFAFVACLVHTAPSDENGMFKTLVEKRLTNLNQHMIRMKSRYEWTSQFPPDLSNLHDNYLQGALI